MATITRLVCEYRENPLGIDRTTPRLSWQMQTSRSGACQVTYRIHAASSPNLLVDDRADLWDSGRVESDQSVHGVYAGKKLTSRQRVYWHVTVWDETGDATVSESAWFEIGLLEHTDWQARWIGTNLVGGPRSTIPGPYLRKASPCPEVSNPGGCTSRRWDFTNAASTGIRSVTTCSRPDGRIMANASSITSTM
jgi:alpha-L-rhamnosidase